MSKIGLFYGPMDGSVAKVARIIADKLGSEKLDLIPVRSATSEDVNKYENIIFGISTIGSHTWARETPSKDWDEFLPELDKINYNGKIFALYGLGDSVTYSLHFVDSMGVLGELLIDREAKIIGQTPTEGYDFQDSEAIVDGKFIGLPLDEDYESDKTEGRIQNWLDIILQEFV